LTSSKLLYSEFSLPETMVIGDKLNIPVTVNNNLNETSTVEIVFEEYRDGAIYQNRIESNQVLSAMGFKKIMY